MLPTFMHTRHRPRCQNDPAAGRRVRLLSWPIHLRPHCYEIGTIEGVIGDELLVRFGEIIVQLPPEMVEPAEE